VTGDVQTGVNRRWVFASGGRRSAGTELFLLLASFVIQRPVVFAGPHPPSAPESTPAPAVEPVAGFAPRSTSR
jgi:hypothetical protein